MDRNVLCILEEVDLNCGGDMHRHQSHAQPSNEKGAVAFAAELSFERRSKSVSRKLANLTSCQSLVVTRKPRPHSKDLSTCTKPGCHAGEPAAYKTHMTCTVSRLLTVGGWIEHGFQLLVTNLGNIERHTIFRGM